MSKPTVWRWRDRFLAEGVDGLLRDATRPPGKKPIEEDRVKAAYRPRDVAAAGARPALDGARRWPKRIGGMAVGTMFTAFLEGHGLKPHQVKTFKVSRGPRFELEVRDVAGLYVNPPDHAVVLSVDEKPRRQAPGSTRRSLPMNVRTMRRRECATAGGTAPPAFWRPWTSPRGRSSGRTARMSAPLGGVPRLPRPRRGKGMRRGSIPEPRCTSFSTTCRPTARPRCTSG